MPPAPHGIGDLGTLGWRRGAAQPSRSGAACRQAGAVAVADAWTLRGPALLSGFVSASATRAAPRVAGPAMLRPQPAACCGRAPTRLARAPAAAAGAPQCGKTFLQRRSVRVCAKFSNPFENFENPFAKGGAGDAAKKSLEGLFGGGKSSGAKPSSGGPPSGGGRPTGGGGGGGEGGGWKWGGGGGAGEEGGSGPEEPIWVELKQLMRGMWVLLTNAAVFLLFANMLHRTLDWCCQVELLLLVGAPRQALERLAGRFFMVVEWLEKNWLGWNIPGEEDSMPLYQHLALYYPPEHAYTFDQYRYPMNAAEKETLRSYYALRWWERDGGFAGDVDPAEVQAIHDKYNPMAADRREFERAKAAGKLDEYWAARADVLERMTGSRAPPAADDAQQAEWEAKQQQRQQQPPDPEKWKAAAEAVKPSMWGIRY